MTRKGSDSLMKDAIRLRPRSSFDVEAKAHELAKKAVVNYQDGP